MLGWSIITQKDAKHYFGTGNPVPELAFASASSVWFTKHHLRCFTINNASSGDKLELEEAAWQHAAALLRGDRANRSGQHSKPSSTLIHKQVSDLEFNLPIYIS